MKELIFAELGYKINGIAFKVDNLLGYGHSEKVYSSAFEELLKKESLEYKRELYWPIMIDGKVIAKRYFDFLVDNKIIIEIKTGNYQFRNACQQLFQYLRASNYKLGLIVRFSKNGVQIKRVVNLL
ncbi:MAG TPA: GxxExxY protein [bacterium]|nr:GxxExxY protein [bacterium]